MGTIAEYVMVRGSDEPLSVLDRDEHLLLSAPRPSALRVKPQREHELLPVVHFSQDYRAQPFAPPRGIFENDKLRLEWQTMDNRQPFYHRNCDVDEISYQIAGERTLITELGVIEHRPGEFSRIPRGVAHDNWGRQESHLLFYVPAPVTEECPAVRASETLIPPFPGWEPGALNEAVTECLGHPEHDIAVFPIDERLLLEHAHEDQRRLQVLRAAPVGTTWLYRCPYARIGLVVQPASDGRVYVRTLDADELQYQIRGNRTVLTQRGVVEIGPGDLFRIPVGITHSDISGEENEYIRVLCDREVPQISDTARTAEPYSPQLLADIRARWSTP